MHLELQELSKRFGKVPALDAVSLDLAPGQIVCVIGLNGAGKTTLLRCLGGIVAPSRGEIRYDGIRFHRERLELRRQLMFLPDFPLGFGEMSVLENAALLLRVYQRDPVPAEPVILRALAELDLLPLAEVPVAQLSRGQLYKTALTGLFAVAPQLWLLDEPFASGLDPQGLAVLKQEARRHALAGGTVLYTTQILEIAARFADRLLVLDHGRLVANYGQEDLAAMPATGPASLEGRLREFRERDRDET